MKLYPIRLKNARENPNPAKIRFAFKTETVFAGEGAKNEGKG